MKTLLRTLFLSVFIIGMMASVSMIVDKYDCRVYEDDNAWAYVNPFDNQIHFISNKEVIDGATIETLPTVGISNALGVIGDTRVPVTVSYMIEDYDGRDEKVTIVGYVRR